MTGVLLRRGNGDTEGKPCEGRRGSPPSIGRREAYGETTLLITPGSQPSISQNCEKGISIVETTQSAVFVMAAQADWYTTSFPPAVYTESVRRSPS